VCQSEHDWTHQGTMEERQAGDKALVRLWQEGREGEGR
jgi:hypothetical protein